MADIISTISSLGIGLAVIFLTISFLLTIFWMWMLVDAIKKNFQNKTLWIILIIILGPLGSLLYLIIAKGKQENTQSTIQIPQFNQSQQLGTTFSETPIFKIEQPVIANLPDSKDSRAINIKYPLIPPYAYAHVHWDQANTELVYEIKEPELSEKEKQILQTLEEGIRELINLSFISVKDKNKVLLYLEKNIKVLLTEYSIKLSTESYLKIMYYIYRDFVGLNELEPLMNDYFIEDIECNGLNTPVYIVHRKYRNIRTNLVYTNIHEMAAFIEKLAQKCGRYVSYAEPVLDGSLPDKSRVNATFTKDITTRGPTFSIRKFTETPWSPIDLMAKGTVSAEILAFVWMMTEYENSYMVVGGTGSGKTSFLNSCAFFIPPQARVVSIEDSITGNSEIIFRENGIIKRNTIAKLTKNIGKKININNIEILTIDKDLKVIFTKPNKFIKHRTTKDIYKVTTSTGRIIEVTKDHSLFTLSLNGLAEVNPEELEINNSYIAVPRTLPIEGRGVFSFNLLENKEIFKEDILIGYPVKKMLDNYTRKDFKVPKTTFSWWKKRGLIRIKYLNKIKYEFSQDELKNLYIKSRNTTKLPVLFQLDECFLKLIGLWLGDGSYDNYNKNSVIISDNEDEAINVYQEVSQKLGIKVSIMGDNWSWRFNSTLLYKFMKYILKLDGYAPNKKIPEFIYNLTNEQLKYIIAGYFGADGTVKDYEISCSSQSDDLIFGTQTLLLRFGIISRIGRNVREDNCKELRISSYENINKFKEISFVHKYKNIKLLSIGNNLPSHTISDKIPINPMWINGLQNYKKHFKNYSTDSFPGVNYINAFLDEPDLIVPTEAYDFLNLMVNSNILWDKVVKIEKLFRRNRYVYDISVPGTEKFIAQNILLHNTRELNLEHENWLPSVARAGVGLTNLVGQKYGEVNLFDLLRASFRQRPDYIIVGEVRGKEAFVLFQAMASGHPGMATMHAENVSTLIKRLETEPINLSGSLIETLAAVIVMSQTRIKGKEARKVSSVDEIIQVKEGLGGEILNNIFRWDPQKDVFIFNPNSKIFSKIATQYGFTKEQVANEFKIRTMLLKEMYKRKITLFKQVQHIIHEYYKSPESVLRRFNIIK